MKQGVIINEDVCRQTAKLIKGIQLRRAFYERPFLRVSVPAEIRFRGYFYSVAICHQTYHLHHKGLKLFGWDYLEYVFTRLMEEQDHFLSPGIFARITFEELKDLLAVKFSPDGQAQNTTLDRLEERAEMLIELDNFLAAKFQSSICKLVEDTGLRLLNEGNGFYEILPSVSAFADPMRKKITFLLKLLDEARMLTLLDPEHFIPIMDYHMQRVLMRIGCIQVVDQDLRFKLVNRSPLTDDEPVRKACIQAFRLISSVSGHAVTKMNDFFWSLGRSCCNEKPLCQAGFCEKKPCTFFEIVEIEKHADCLFQSVCKGYSDEKYRQLWQPIVNTHYY
jgi:hypothetical protein